MKLYSYFLLFLLCKDTYKYLIILLLSNYPKLPPPAPPKEGREGEELLKAFFIKR
jgi:hypothetical protein